jgi:hypothetical protein
MNGTADMGDGNNITIGADGLGTHTYAAAGTYTVVFSPSDGNAAVSTVVEAVEIVGNPPWSWPAADADSRHFLFIDRAPDNDLSFFVNTEYAGNSEATHDGGTFRLTGTIYVDAPGNPNARCDGWNRVRFDMLAPGTYRVGFEPDPDLAFQPHGIMISSVTVGPIDRSVEWIDWRGYSETRGPDGPDAQAFSPYAVDNIDLGWPGAAGLWTWSARWNFTKGDAVMNLQIPGSNAGVKGGLCTPGQRFDGGDGYTYEVGPLEYAGGQYYVGAAVVTPYKYYKIGRVMPPQVK